MEGGKDRFVDLGRKVLTDGEMRRQISRLKGMSGQMEERTGDKIRRKKHNLSLSS